jgi:hypothetical protein
MKCDEGYSVAVTDVFPSFFYFHADIYYIKNMTYLCDGTYLQQPGSPSWGQYGQAI